MSNTNCPVSMEIIPGGVGWADVKVNIFEDSFTFVISYIGDSISDLVERVYYLHPIFDHDDYDYRIMEYYEEVEAGENIDGEEIGPEWENIPWRRELLWDGEGSSVKWTFERPKTIKADCDLTIKLRRSWAIFSPVTRLCRRRGSRRDGIKSFPTFIRWPFFIVANRT